MQPEQLLRGPAEFRGQIAPVRQEFDGIELRPLPATRINRRVFTQQLGELVRERAGVGGRDSKGGWPSGS